MLERSYFSGSKLVQVSCCSVPLPHGALQLPCAALPARSFSSSEASPELHNADLHYRLRPEALPAAPMLAAARQNLYTPATLSVSSLQALAPSRNFSFLSVVHVLTAERKTFKNTDAGYPSTHNIQASNYRFCQDDCNYTKALEIQLSLKYKFCPAAASSLVWWKSASIPGSSNVAAGSNRRLQQTQHQVDEVVDIMRVNVDKVLERDQKLSELDDRADALQAGASQFETSAAKLKRKYWWKNCKMWAILIAVVIIIIIIIIVWNMPS
ncbi:PREDICTED: vesicle-associated membrane protein 3 [Pygoscelis adeliae]|nr:PREDICTED: vesicle-associated membrane protein 3 [Pygoscelis adeliae]